MPGADCMSGAWVLQVHILHHLQWWLLLFVLCFHYAFACSVKCLLALLVPRLAVQLSLALLFWCVSASIACWCTPAVTAVSMQSKQPVRDVATP